MTKEQWAAIIAEYMNGKGRTQYLSEDIYVDGVLKGMSLSQNLPTSFDTDLKTENIRLKHEINALKQEYLEYREQIGKYRHMLSNQGASNNLTIKDIKRMCDYKSDLLTNITKRRF